ncbi:MAG: hypothetical protein M3P51_00810 [Chloroflexota bacterium]|nr:hypothetical protein [Chloroflexota bacterium]
MGTRTHTKPDDAPYTGSTPLISPGSQPEDRCPPRCRRSLGTLASLMIEVAGEHGVVYHSGRYTAVDTRGQAYTYNWTLRKLTAEQRVGLRLLILSESEAEELGGRLEEVCAAQADRALGPLGRADGW